MYNINVSISITKTLIF